jgi:hypothetical protein
MTKKHGKKARLKKKDKRREKRESQEVGVFVGHKKVKPEYEDTTRKRR